MCAHSKKQRGFTLIEMMLVVVVLAVVLGLAAPNFHTAWQRLSLQQAVDQIAYVMRYAQNRAIKDDRQERLIFDADRREYVLKEEAIDTQSSGTQRTFSPISGKWGRVFVLPDGIDAQFTQSEVNFFPDGKIDRARISLCRQDRCMTVSTKEQIGFVDVFEGRLE